jgi:hypothetical protein
VGRHKLLNTPTHYLQPTRPVYGFPMSSGGRSIRFLRCLALLILTAAVSPATSRAASPVLIDGLGKTTVALSGPWQFHVGDDLSWASPTFDDSNWETIDVTRPWGDQGHWAYAGHAWYRRHIDFADKSPTAADIALYVPATTCSYEVYWNGRLIGHTDAMPAPTMINVSAAAMYAIGNPRQGVLAFRASTTPLDTTLSGNQLGLMALPQIGVTDAIRNLADSSRAAQMHSRLLTTAQIVIYAELSLLGALVWLRNRNRKLLFWMFAFLISTTLWVSMDFLFFPWMVNNPLEAAFYGPTFHSFEDITLWYLLLYLLNLDRYPALVKWTRILAWITFVSAIGDVFTFYVPFIDPDPLKFQILDALFTVGFSVPAIFPFVLIALAFRKRMDRSRQLVAIAAFLADMYFVVHHTAVQGERFTRLTFGDRMMNPMFTLAGVEVSMPAILNLFLVCTIVYAIYRYMVEQTVRQTSLEQEFLNARAVQQVLVPEAIPTIPGFAMQSVYKPFGEVGGDFFQVLPLANGGVLTVVGDVSGKGMPAAMTVSLLVGTVRTLAHYTQSPADILAAMNHRMIGRSHGGFTTCLVLRADPDGTLTIANAGHIGPYLAGHELPLENGLPLGLAAEATYTESTFHLTPADQLTLLTDGVVEARDPSGALFGFDRTAALSLQPAETIAQTAQTFGQDDDITVLTLTRLSRESGPAQS